jgi:polygalacturonase
VASVVVLVSGIIATLKTGGTTDQGFRCSAKGSTATNRVTVTGADRSGSKDDSAAIQDAIDAAGRRGGGIVNLPAGTFMIDRHLLMRKNVELTGAGPATVIKAGPGFMTTQGPGGGYPIISTAGASDTTISNLTADQHGDVLDGNVAARLAGYVVEARDSSNVVIDSVYIRNPFTYSIAAVASTSFCIQNNNVLVTTLSKYDQLDGIHILDSSQGQVVGNTVQSGDDGLVAHTIGGPVHDVLYADNRVHGGAYTDGLQLAVGNFPVYNIQIRDNDFYGSQFGIRTGYYGNRTGAVRNISISGNNIHDLTEGRQYPAIAIGGFGGLGPVKNVDVTDNHTCRAGEVTVQAGPGNVITGTTGCSPGHSLSRQQFRI